MSIGLDLTTFCFRSLRVDGRVLATRNCRADMVPIGKSPIHRQLLDQLRLAYAECDNHLLIWGEQANRYADVFHSTCIPLLSDGDVPENQPPIRQMLAYFMEGLLPPASTPHEVCGVAFAQSRRAPRQATVDFFHQLINLCGYRVETISPAHALALAELNVCQYSGIVLHLGAAVSDFCVMHHGTILWRQSVELFDCLPPALSETFQTVLLTNELETTDVATPSAAADSVVTRCQVMQTVMEQHFAGLAAAELFTPTSNPLPLLLGGECPRGSAVVSDLQQEMVSLSGPIPISEVRWPIFGEHAVARGCLIHAELDTQKTSPRAA